MEPPGVTTGTCTGSRGTPVPITRDHRPADPAYLAAMRAAEDRVAALDLPALTNAGLYREPHEYYLVANYPPLKALRPIPASEVYAGITPTQNIYLHVPFCEQYCSFCHFAKEIRPKLDRVETYLSAIMTEIDMVAEQVPALHAETLYFGGGTPSYLRPDQLDRLFTHLDRRVTRSTDCEVTFELHPGVIRQPDFEDRIRTLRDHGVNRWVFGVQSMDEVVLRKLNRGHGTAEVYGLLEILARHGCDNLSVDLIFGLPYQTPENWYATITALLAAGIQKFNVYPLMFKRSDPISLHYLKNPEIFPDSRQRLLLHYLAEEMLLPLGYQRRPVFYYAKDKHHSRQQDSKYDEKAPTDLVAFGVSGHGYVGHTQYYNICDMNEYLAAVGRRELPVWRGEHLAPDERMRRTIMLSLRARGVSRSTFTELHGVDPVARFSAEFGLLDRLGLVTITPERVDLTDSGAYFADGAGLIFASDQVRDRIAETNHTIQDPRRDLREIHDYYPLGRLTDMLDPTGSVAASA